MSHYKKLLTALGCALALLIFIVVNQKSEAAEDGFFEPTEAQQSSLGFDISSIDRSANACVDFNQFANGGWVKKNPIPAAYPSWGRFNELQEKNRDTLHTILEDAAKDTKATKGSIEQKIGDYYATCMDEQKIEAEGLKPLMPELSRIEKLTDPHSLQAEIAHLHIIAVNVPFTIASTQDYKESTKVIADADQGGLGLPDRDYYLKDDERSKTLRDAYVKHVARMFELMGDDADKAAKEAQTVMNIETGLAKAALPRADRRDPDKTYHKMTVAELNSLTPNFSWTDYFKAIGYPNISAVNMEQPEFFKEINRQMAALPVADWKTYLRWHLIHNTAARLSSKFVDENFNFYGATLTGTKENLPRWKRCVSGVDRSLGEALGQAYVKKTFPPEAKARALEMVNNLIAALRSDLSTLSWMSQETRDRATNKLQAFARKIGYPDKWRDYSGLKVNRSSYLENTLRSTEFNFKYDLDKIGKPVNRTEWGMTPPTVNAYYNPLMNEIVFPAGILQPPFFDPKADDAINYGGMGAVIGHEMTHGFDDQGAKFDPQGNLKNWWSDADLKNFQDRAGCVERQFSGYKVEDNLFLNGKLVLGESIADLGGLTVAYAALEKALEGKPRTTIDGFTPEQRFFLGWAQIWADNMRPEFARLLAQTNEHPLSRFRVNGPLSNMLAFAKAFGCKTGDPMLRAENERCQIW